MQAAKILYSTIYQCLSQLDQDPKGSGTAPTVLYCAAQLECDRLPLWSIHPCRKFIPVGKRRQSATVGRSHCASLRLHWYEQRSILAYFTLKQAFGAPR